MIKHSTITGNQTDAFGGGLYTCCGGTTTVKNSDVSGNTPDDIVREP